MNRFATFMGLSAILFSAGCQTLFHGTPSTQAPQQSQTDYWTGYVYTTLGIEVDFDRSVRSRYRIFRDAHAQDISRIDALEYLALHPSACTEYFFTVCKYDKPRGNDLYRIMRERLTEETRGGITWSITDQGKALQSRVFSQDTIRVRTPPTIHTIETVRTDTVYVDRPVLPPSISFQEHETRSSSLIQPRMPDNTLFFRRLSRTYTFPGATLVCYERPVLECVTLPRQ